MEDFKWKTNESHSNNSVTMDDFFNSHIESHCGTDYNIVYEDGSYAEIVNSKKEHYAIHASGDGDFFNHKIEFEKL